MKIVIKALDNDINIIKNVQKFLFIQIIVFLEKFIPYD